MAGESVLDLVVPRLLAVSPYRFTVPNRPQDREVAYRLRYETVVAMGWADPADFPDGLERDGYDDRAVQVVGWLDDEAVSTGRVVLPPGPLPTEEACGLVVEPVGQVVDVGRMLVRPAWQDPAHGALRDLMARLYIETRALGYTVACGMMSSPAWSLARLLGVRLEPLGPPRTSWHELRYPVRFEVEANVPTMVGRWTDPAEPSAEAQS